MHFNFGDTKFKYKPYEGYVGFAAADPSLVVENEKTGDAMEERRKVNNAPQAIILEPSRELAEQTLRQLQAFKARLPAPGVSELLVVGGQGNSARDQIAALQAGVDIVSHFLVVVSMKEVGT